MATLKYMEHPQIEVMLGGAPDAISRLVIDNLGLEVTLNNRPFIEKQELEDWKAEEMKEEVKVKMEGRQS